MLPVLVLVLAGSASAEHLRGTTPARQTKGCLTAAERRAPKTAGDWVVCLKATKTNVPVDSTVAFDAETNGNMRKGERRLVIRDQTTGSTVKSCKHERTCFALVAHTEPGGHRYVAEVHGGKKHTPHSKQVRVSWVAISITLVDYVHSRGPRETNPAKLCESEAAAVDCATTVGLGISVDFWVETARPIPPGWKIKLVANTAHGSVPYASQTNLDSCREKIGCWIGLVDGEKQPVNAGFVAALYNDEDVLVGHSELVKLDWLDWTPTIDVTPGNRQCDSQGRNCYYTQTVVTAHVKQPLTPGVVIVLNSPYGSCGPSPGTVTQCTVGPLAGGLVVGTKPRAQVFLQTTQPYVEYGSAEAPPLP
jgi:hypothetical protein